MRKRRGRTRTVRRRRGVNRPGGTPETTWEAGWLLCNGLGLPDQPAPPSHDPFWWSVCEVHDPTGEPGAGNPHAGFGERGPGNAAMGAGLRPGAKATDKPPDPKAGAPAPDSTDAGGSTGPSTGVPVAGIKSYLNGRCCTEGHELVSAIGPVVILESMKCRNHEQADIVRMEEERTVPQLFL